jgi:hypothetical protein
MLQKLWQPHTQNITAHKLITGKNKAFGKHIFQYNDIEKKFAYNKDGGVDLLEEPVCGHCERLGSWHDQPFPGSCHCFACGKDTPYAITMRQYLMEHLDVSEIEMAVIEKEIAEAKG